jgi:3-oxoadipate enol-lactonase
MYAEIEGDDGAPDLVCLHGGIGTGRFHWSKQLDALADAFRIHLPDLPGHGNTPLPEDGAYSRQVQTEAVAAYLNDIGPPVHVAGFSMGGHAALALAAEQPDLFASLALVGVSVREHEGLHGWRNEFDPDDLAEAYPLFARKLSKLHAPLGGEDAWKDVCRRDAKGLEVEVDVDALAGLEAPVLLVRGDRDPAVDPAQYAELRARWPQADEMVVPAGHHDVQLTRAALVAPGLRDFFDRASG